MAAGPTEGVAQQSKLVGATYDGQIKKVHWCNVIQNHQNGQPLLVLDPNIEGYETIKLYQWEMCVQFHSQGASDNGPTMDVGDKIRSIVVKLQEMHRKEKLLVFTEGGKMIQLETIPKGQWRSRATLTTWCMIGGGIYH
eukprot:4701333-Ditylum_brightwellii.AAC.1